MQYKVNTWVLCLVGCDGTDFDENGLQCELDILFGCRKALLTQNPVLNEKYRFLATIWAIDKDEKSNRNIIDKIKNEILDKKCIEYKVIQSYLFYDGEHYFLDSISELI